MLTWVDDHIEIMSSNPPNKYQKEKWKQYGVYVFSQYYELLDSVILALSSYTWSKPVTVVSFAFTSCISLQYLMVLWDNVVILSLLISIPPRLMQNSYGFWTRSLEKWAKKTVMEKWRKFCKPCRAYLHLYHQESMVYLFS